MYGIQVVVFNEHKGGQVSLGNSTPYHVTLFNFNLL